MVRGLIKTIKHLMTLIQEAKMAAKLLMKRFAIKDVRQQVSQFGSIVDILLTEVPSWMKQFDEDRDGRLSYKEFKHAILPPKEENEPTSVSAVTSSSEPAQIREQGAEIENIV